MTESKLDVFRFWGKARPLCPDHGPGWHPLIFHCLDVAAVGEALLAKHRRMGDHLARLLGLEREETVRLATWLLCLHDVGKLAKKFQAKDPDLYPPCFGDDPARLSGFYDHGAGGLRLFDADDGFFKLPSGTRPRTWRPLVSAVTAHRDRGQRPEPHPRPLRRRCPGGGGRELRLQDGATRDPCGARRAERGGGGPGGEDQEELRGVGDMTGRSEAGAVPAAGPRDRAPQARRGQAIPEDAEPDRQFGRQAVAPFARRLARCVRIAYRATLGSWPTSSRTHAAFAGASLPPPCPAWPPPPIPPTSSSDPRSERPGSEAARRLAERTEDRRRSHDGPGTVASPHVPQELPAPGDVHGTGGDDTAGIAVDEEPEVPADGSGATDETESTVRPFLPCPRSVWYCDATGLGEHFCGKWKADGDSRSHHPMRSHRT